MRGLRNQRSSMQHWFQLKKVKIMLSIRRWVHCAASGFTARQTSLVRGRWVHCMAHEFTTSHIVVRERSLVVRFTHWTVARELLTWTNQGNLSNRNDTTRYHGACFHITNYVTIQKLGGDLFHQFAVCYLCHTARPHMPTLMLTMQLGTKKCNTHFIVWQSINIKRLMQ